MRVSELGIEQASEPKFKVGDRVKIIAYPSHDPYHYGRGATVVEVNPGPAYGLIIDGMESMGTHKWYVGSELGEGPEQRTVGRLIIIPDIIMGLAGAAGIIHSIYVKNPTLKMVELMLGSMAFAVAAHGALMRLIENQVGAAINCAPAK